MRYFFTILFLIVIVNPILLFGQDTGKFRLPDTPISIAPQPDSISMKSVVYAKAQQVINEHKYLNHAGIPGIFAAQKRNPGGFGWLFLLLVGISLYFAILKTVFSKYFSNLIRVFFNTSLRQTQLTEQLIDVPQASLLFNVLFFLASGTYIYLLLNWLNVVEEGAASRYLLFAIAIPTLVYSVKFLVLKFFGWLTGLQKDAKLYSFNVFLINKVIGVVLLPLSFLIAFGGNSIAQVSIILSITAICILLLMRFYKSFGMMQGRLKVGSWHFFLYMICLEILPILLIIKSVIVFFK